MDSHLFTYDFMDNNDYWLMDSNLFTYGFMYNNDY